MAAGQLEWVRSIQPAGGKSKWHVLASRRFGPVGPAHAIGRGAPAAPIDFALTACAFVLSPYETCPRLGPSSYYAAVAVPLDRQGRPLPPYGNTIVCERCFELAAHLVSSHQR